MAELRKMPWDGTVWKALRAAVSPIPPFVRKKALVKIIEASEKNALDRSSPQVEAPDLIAAAREKVPGHMLKICLEALAEQGIKEN